MKTIKTAIETITKKQKYIIGYTMRSISRPDAKIIKIVVPTIYNIAIPLGYKLDSIWNMDKNRTWESTARCEEI